MLVKTFKAFLLLQIGIERELVIPIHVRLLHLGERGIIVNHAEFMDLFITARCLPAKLVAGNVQDHLTPVFGNAKLLMYVLSYYIS